ncbi:MAG: transposase zinc-binding domain-containing protein [bacterium]
MLETFTGNYTLKQILKDNCPAFLAKHNGKIRPTIIKEVEKVINCGDKDKMGCHLYVCPNCGEEKFVPHTCKSRFCNSCGSEACITYYSFEEQVIKLQYCDKVTAQVL